MRSVGVHVAVVVVLMVLRTAAQTEVNTDSTIDIATQMTIQTTIDCPMVTCWELCDWMIGSDGCPTCDCPSTCERATCGPFSKCIPNNNCPSCYSCIPDTTTTPRTTTVECPVISCAPNCFPNFTPQPDGCFTCDCYPTCNRDTTCSQGETCVMQYECASCIGVPTCVPDTTTTTITTTNATKPPCPIPLCLKECPPVRGPDGCLNCVCLNCQNLTCDSGEECVMQGGDCSPEEMPCVPHPTCVPLYATTTTPCPLIRCAPGWESTTGPGGCPTCVLLPSCQVRVQVCQTPVAAGVASYTVGPTDRWLTPARDSATTAALRVSTLTALLQRARIDAAEGLNLYARLWFVRTTAIRTRERTVVRNASVQTHARDTIALRVTSASWKKQGVTTFNQNHSAFQSRGLLREPCNIRCRYGLMTDENGCQVCQCQEAPSS